MSSSYRPAADASLYVLLAANVAVLALAYLLQMTLRSLMLVYWLQSVAIGVAHFIRLRRLRRFDTRGFADDGKPPEPTVELKEKLARYFAFFYGFFHLGYLAFILRAEAALGNPLAYVPGALAFGFSHAYSVRLSMARDAAGCPNIGMLFFMPFLRIIPMHLVIVSGLAVTSGAGAFAVLLFGALKTAADALMHVVQHQVIAHGSSNELVP